MPARTVPLANGEYYHIINRGVARVPIFLNARDYQRFMKTFNYYMDGRVITRYSLSDKEFKFNPGNQIIDIVSFCLMPNHFHFLLKQNEDDGIRNFVRKTTNSYAKYFNIKRKRKGPLFEGTFKAERLPTDAQLKHIFASIHLEPASLITENWKELDVSAISSIAKKMSDYRYSSLAEYITSDHIVCDPRQLDRKSVV